MPPRSYWTTRSVLLNTLKAVMSPKSPKASSLSSPSPYLLQEDSAGYYFRTDSGVTYRLFFNSDEDYLPGEALADLVLSFSIVPISGPDKRKDPRIKDTVIEALRRVFDSNPDYIILYTCSTDNEQEVMRSRLFNAWHISNGKGYAKIDHQDEKNRAHTSAIFREGHPLEGSIRSTFDRVFVNK